MKDVYLEFADKVDFYAIGQSPFESIDQLESYRVKEGYPWPIAEVNLDTLKELRVLRQSTKIVLDHQGVITYRAGYADGGADTWREVFSDLVDRAGG
ncbi:uncharacterized protein METZ01_LOCUS33121 [marine metagenome]|uniref:Alkyl hydroperoxide reductase subunit C/ Thiol specific antioxidant domain-containing protein n=1 Tax=marine metagenome TaxID=408172 RepID=A0A381QQW1_9ZZZZ